MSKILKIIALISVLPVFAFSTTKKKVVKKKIIELVVAFESEDKVDEIIDGIIRDYDGDFVIEDIVVKETKGPGPFTMSLGETN